MHRNREDYPNLTDDEFAAISWYSIEGTCDRCHQVGVKCYHILKAGLHKFNGDECLKQFMGGMNLYWRRDIKKLLSSRDDYELHQQSTSGHFCMKCANVVAEVEEEYMIEEFGHYIKDNNITFCLTQIADDVLLLHVE